MDESVNFSVCVWIYTVLRNSPKEEEDRKEDEEASLGNPTALQLPL